MRKLLSTLILALIVVCVEAKTYKTIKNAETIASVNLNYGALKVREVVMRDTATTVHFTMDYQKGSYFRFTKESYLMDEDGHRYPLRSAEGIALDSWVQSPESGVTNFTMHFAPLPKNTQIFDFIEGDGTGAFEVLGIHDKKYKIKYPTLQELSDANPWTVPTDWFKTDTITIKGRIEGFDAERVGFNMLRSNFRDDFEKNHGTQIMDIAPDGTFCAKFKASYPTRNVFYANEYKTQFSSIPYFARPGETIDITVRLHEDGWYDYSFNSGSSYDVQRWLRSSTGYNDALSKQMNSFKGNLEEGNKFAEKAFRQALYLLQIEGRRSHYTPMEMQLALADLQVNFVFAYFSLIDNYASGLVKYEERDGVWYEEVLDSVALAKLDDVKSYSPLRLIDFDNPLLLSSDKFSFMLNRVQFADYVRNRHYKGIKLVDGDIEAFVYANTFENNSIAFHNYLAAFRELMGGEKDKLIGQLCGYKDLLSNFDHYVDDVSMIKSITSDTTTTEARKKEIIENLNKMPTRSKMIPLYLNAFTHPYIHQKAEQYIESKKAKTDIATPLPDTPAADLIRSFCDKYPGKILVIDFWGMSCGPCRAAIQESKALRAEIAKRDDVKLIFIAEERTAEGSDEYKKYVSEWLDGETTVCVTRDFFARLEELFQFSSIPHYETITPDGCRVREDLRIDGYDNLKGELYMLKEKLKQ